MYYRKEIDGLRALAIIPVILFHAGFKMFSGGFVGVDIFFVISGYLITTILIHELNKGNFRLAKFYERRARRILPALFFVMLFCLIVVCFLFTPVNINKFLKSIIFVSIYSSNILFWKESGYFDIAAETKPLLHTWSLAVEEQYYLLFPIFLITSWKLGRVKIITFIVLVGLSSFLLAQWMSINKPTAAFYILPTRCWELLLGSFVAFYLSNTNREKFSKNINEIGGIIGAALIMYSIFTYNKETPFPSHYTLAPTIGASFIIIFATQQTISGRAIGNKIFVALGLVSYSAYLWHQPLFAFARVKSLSEPSGITFATLSIFSFILAYFSWKYIERPFRNDKIFNKIQIFYISAALSAFFIIIGLVGIKHDKEITNYWINKFPQDQHLFYRKLSSEKKSDLDFGSDISGKQEISECSFNTNILSEKIKSKINECRKKYGAGVLILGDSHAIDLYGEVASRFSNKFIVGITSGGCRPHTPKPECQYIPIKSFIKNNNFTFSHVIYEQAGFYLLTNIDGEKGNREMFSRIDHNSEVSGINVDEENIKKTLDYLNDISTHTPTTWFLPRFEPHISQSALIKYGCKYNWQPRKNLDDVFFKLDKKITDLVNLKKNSRLKVYSQVNLMKIKFPDDLLNCSDIYWNDGDHLSSSGEIMFGKRLPSNFLEF